VWHSANDGPNFGGNDLGLSKEPMNGEGHGSCFINEWTYWDMGCFEDGNHVLTGHGGDQEGNEKTWTCAAVEVYKLTGHKVLIPNDFENVSVS